MLIIYIWSAPTPTSPRWLQSMEPGSPLMVDDLRRRREELECDVANALAGATPVARGTMESAIVRLSSIGFPLQQFRLSETLDQMCTDARRLYAERRSRLEAQD